jgi:hypothetical protein
MKVEYPKYPILIENVYFKGYEDAGIFLSCLRNDNIPALFIVNTITGEPYANCNINPEDYKLKDFEFAIKDYSENECMLEWLLENDFVDEPHDFFGSGFVVIPVCRASEKLKKFILDNCALL